MNKRIMKMLILCISFFIYFPVATVKAQELFDCPPNTSEGEWGDPIHGIIEPTPMNFLGHTYYFERTVDEKVEIIVDWETFENLNRPVSDETMKEMMLLWLAKHIFDPEWECPFNEPRSVSFIEQTECRTTTKCVIHLDKTQQVSCCDDPNTNPEIYNRDQEYYYNIYQDHFCGYKCCEKVVTLECHNGIKVVTSMIKQDYPDSSCPEDNSYFDCLTNQPIPCVGNCE